MINSSSVLNVFSPSVFWVLGLKGNISDVQKKDRRLFLSLTELGEKDKITVWILLLVEHLQHLHCFFSTVARNTLKRECVCEREITFSTLGAFEKYTSLRVKPRDYGEKNRP